MQIELTKDQIDLMSSYTVKILSLLAKASSNGNRDRNITNCYINLPFYLKKLQIAFNSNSKYILISMLEFTNLLSLAEQILFSEGLIDGTLSGELIKQFAENKTNNI